MSQAPAAPSTNGIRLSTDVTALIRNSSHPDHDAVSVGAVGVGALLNGQAIGLPAHVEMDALFVYSNRIVFSTDIAFKTNSTVYADEDLVEYNVNTGTLTLYFDGSANGIPPDVDLDAACLVSGTSVFLFSIDITATLPSVGTVTDEDVIRYNGAFSLEHDGTATLDIPSVADIDALYREGGDLYFSLDKTATINAQTGGDGDVWVYDGGSTTLHLVNSLLPDPADLTSLDVPVDTDSDSLTDFEEISGIDDPASADPDTGGPMDPGGKLTDLNDPDSDDDGFNDGEEALAGTDPADETDLLTIVDIMSGGGTNVLAWPANTNRFYTVEASTNLPGNFFVVQSGIVPAGTNAMFTHVPGGLDPLYYRIRVSTVP